MEQLDASEATELRKVVRCLMSFIVKEGKELIPENTKDEYVRRYLYRFTKSMNGMNECITTGNLETFIAEDVAGFIERPSGLDLVRQK